MKNNINKSWILGIFWGLIFLDLILLFGLKTIKNKNAKVSAQKVLDFKDGFVVKLDLDYLRKNFGSAHE